MRPRLKPRLKSAIRASSSINMRPSRWLLALLALFILGTVRPTTAHGYLVRSIPEDRAVFDRAPARLQYWFSENLETEFSRVTVLDRDGAVVAEGGVSPDNDSLMTVTMPRDLADGTYIVDMRVAFASDGHVIAQSRVFFIGVADAGIAGESPVYQASPLEVLWRALLLTATMLLFGIFTVYSGILVPAWGNPAYRAGLLPPRVINHLIVLIIIGLALAVTGQIIAILQQTMAFFDADLSRVIEGQLWSAVRLGTRFGELWNARFFLLGVVALSFAASLRFREQYPAMFRPFWTANAWALALVIGSFSAGSHAAGSPVLPWVAVFNDWLHGQSVGFWAGGLSALTLTLPVALAPYQGEARRKALLAALRRFSRWAVVCVALVIVTGLYSALTWLYTPGDVTQTAFGGSLLLKLVLVGGLVLLGGLHHVALRPERFPSLSARLGLLDERRVERPFAFLTTLRLETVAVLLVLTSVGLLSATPVPVPYFVRESLPPLTDSQTVGDLELQMTLTPGGPGVNTIDARLSRDGAPLDVSAVTVQLVDPARERRSDWLVAEASGDGLYIGSSADIDRAGVWLALVDVRLADGSVQRAAFRWTISDEAAIQLTQPPRPQNLLALLGVLLVCGWALLPAGQRLYQRLDLSPATVAVVIGATATLILLSAAAFIYIQNTQTAFETTLNPPPAFVNPTLPDQASLERGEAVYAEYCQEWPANIVNRLVERLPRTRDDQLFDLTRDGWQGFPGCAPGPTDDQRWDLVNFIRTLQRT